MMICAGALRRGREDRHGPERVDDKCAHTDELPEDERRAAVDARNGLICKESDEEEAQAGVHGDDARVLELEAQRGGGCAQRPLAGEDGHLLVDAAGQRGPVYSDKPLWRSS